MTNVGIDNRCGGFCGLINHAEPHDDLARLKASGPSAGVMSLRLLVVPNRSSGVYFTFHVGGIDPPPSVGSQRSSTK
jgi:hypothetical protein